MYGHATDKQQWWKTKEIVQSSVAQTSPQSALNMVKDGEKEALALLPFRIHGWVTNAETG
jgi:hypothetical protein